MTLINIDKMNDYEKLDYFIQFAKKEEFKNIFSKLSDKEKTVYTLDYIKASIFDQLILNSDGRFEFMDCICDENNHLIKTFNGKKYKIFFKECID
jgi:hypothetical protein